MDQEQQGRLSLPAPGTRTTGTKTPWLLTVRCAIFMLLGLVLAFARVADGGAPFGMAMVACAGAGISGVFTLTGASLGYLVSGGLDWGVRYIASAVLVYTVSFVFHELPVYRSRYFMPACAGTVMALTGFLGSFSATVESAPLAAKLIMETVMAFGGTYFFKEALTDNLRTTETAELCHATAVMIMTGCLLMAVSRLVILNTVSVGRFLALLIVMASALKGGVLTGCAVGTILGLSMDMGNEGAAFYTMAYSFSGLLSGVFARHGRFLFTLSFVLAGAMIAACTWNTGPNIGAMFETFCASVIFMILPSDWLNRFGLILQSMERGSGETGLRRFAAGRVMNLSSAYSELYETVRKSVDSPYNDENISRIFDRAADEVCVKCRFRSRCWAEEYMDTLSAMNDATKAMISHGSLEVEDIPEHFRTKCVDLTAFVAAVNGELRGLSYRKRLKNCLEENRQVAWGQYNDIAAILGNIADELGNVSGTEPMAERRLMRYLRSLDMDADVSVYRDGSGRMRLSIESGRLTPLLNEKDYLTRISTIVGVRMSQQTEPEPGDGSILLLEAEPLAVSVGIAALKKKGEKVSGDKGTYFKTDSGVLNVILSDGMGSGDEAARDSQEVVEILEKFLRSGVDPAVAMKILNSVLLLRDGENWGYTGVDLMCVDLFTGETCFYKYGAAPSYVKNGRKIERISGEALAAGLSSGEGIAPDIVRMKLHPGSTAIIATDGVIADSQDEWLKELLQKGFEDMKALAKAVLKEAEKLYGANDDMTVITVRVEERS